MLVAFIVTKLCFCKNNKRMIVVVMIYEVIILFNVHVLLLHY
jgi:hypothetical protein